MYFLKGALIIILVAMMLAPPSLAICDTYYVVVDSGARVRTDTSIATKENVITTLRQGDEVSATGRYDGLWAEIDRIDGVHITTDCRIGEIENITGWMHMSLLSETPITSKAGVIDSNGRVNLREAPDGDAKRVCWMNPGDEVTVVGSQYTGGQKWLYVICGSSRGFVVAEYVCTDGF